ncbi:hypothetical protein [Sorangium cellulosum]|uniref:hypothetical protein n=1 Tax=Sorangium cellulosum TaxID=56 RepID=UPI00032352B8|nr:hypothetical protein [Sorangium cellulosum]
MSAAVHVATLLRMGADALDVQVRTMRAQADAIEVGGISVQLTPRYATAKLNPLGSARAFLDAGRRGHFATFKRRREVVALWTDVETWIESRKLARRERKPVDDADDDRALLEKAGIPLRPSNRRTTRR